MSTFLRGAFVRILGENNLEFLRDILADGGNVLLDAVFKDVLSVLKNETFVAFVNKGCSKFIINATLCG